MNALKDRDQITLRLTKSLKENITKKAEAAGMPVNSYILWLLTEALEEDAS